jgi:hypothetical protein
MKKGMVFLMVLTVLCIWFTFTGSAHAETLILSASPLECNVGDTITVTYHGAPGNPASSPYPGDAIGLFPVTASNISQAVAVQYLNGSMDGTLTFTAPDQVGAYNIRMLAEAIATIAVTPDIHVHTQAVLSATPAVADPRDSIAVTYSGAPGTPSDSIALFEADALGSGGQFIDSQSLNSAKSGVLTFNAPDKPGTYNFQMFTGNLKAALATSNDVQIENMVMGTPVQIVLQAYSPAMTVNGATTVIDPASGVVPIIKNGRALLPIRAIVESIGGTVNWDANEQEMTIQVENRTIQLGIGQTTAAVNGASVPIDVAPQIFNGSILLPLRFVAENLGMAVQWDAASQTVTLTYKRGTWTQPS